MRDKAFLPTIIFFIIILLSIAQLIVSNKLATDGVVLERVEKDITFYSEHSMLLQEEVIKNIALTHISSKAAELGFVRSNDILTISGSLGLSFRQ